MESRYLRTLVAQRLPPQFSFLLQGGALCGAPLQAGLWRCKGE